MNVFLRCPTGPDVTSFSRPANGCDPLAGRIVNVGTWNRNMTRVLNTQGYDGSAEYAEHVVRLKNHLRLDESSLAVWWDGRDYRIVYSSRAKEFFGMKL